MEIVSERREFQQEDMKGMNDMKEEDGFMEEEVFLADPLTTEPMAPPLRIRFLSMVFTGQETVKIGPGDSFSAFFGPPCET